VSLSAEQLRALQLLASSRPPLAGRARPLRAGLAGAQTAGAVVGAVRWQVRSPVAFACRLRNDVENTVPGGAVLKRPKRRDGVRYPNKPKYLDKAQDPIRLENAAVNAKYEPSQYHCPLPDGRPPLGRAKPASHCPDGWTSERALVCIRQAIRAGRVSRQWVGDFPRHVWHSEARVWYEACTTNGTPGVYHAYQIEIVGVPPGLTP